MGFAYHGAQVDTWLGRVSDAQARVRSTKASRKRSYMLRCTRMRSRKGRYAWLRKRGAHRQRSAYDQSAIIENGTGFFPGSGHQFLNKGPRCMMPLRCSVHR